MLDEIAADKDADGFHPLNVGALAMRGRAPAAGPFLRIFSPPCAAAPPPPVPSSDRELPWTVSASFRRHARPRPRRRSLPACFLDVSGSTRRSFGSKGCFWMPLGHF